MKYTSMVMCYFIISFAFFVLFGFLVFIFIELKGREECVECKKNPIIIISRGRQGLKTFNCLVCGSCRNIQKDLWTNFLAGIVVHSELNESYKTIRFLNA